MRKKDFGERGGIQGEKGDQKNDDMSFVIKQKKNKKRIKRSTPGERGGGKGRGAPVGGEGGKKLKEKKKKAVR